MANPRNLKTPNIYSEISSIAEDRSVKSQYVLNSVLSFEGAGSKPPSRMETYMADWSELPKVWQFWFWNFLFRGKNDATFLQNLYGPNKKKFQ